MTAAYYFEITSPIYGRNQHFESFKMVHNLKFCHVVISYCLFMEVGFNWRCDMAVSQFTYELTTPLIKVSLAACRFFFLHWVECRRQASLVFVSALWYAQFIWEYVIRSFSLHQVFSNICHGNRNMTKFS